MTDTEKLLDRLDSLCDAVERLIAEIATSHSTPSSFPYEHTTEPTLVPYPSRGVERP